MPKTTKMPFMPTYKYADVSMCHLTEDDVHTLSAIKDDDSFPLTIAEYTEGFFIPLGDGKEWLDSIRGEFDKYSLSEDFVKLLERCIDERVFCLRLDRDGTEIDGLKKHDW